MRSAAAAAAAAATSHRSGEGVQPAKSGNGREEGHKGERAKRVEASGYLPDFSASRLHPTCIPVHRSCMVPAGGRALGTGKADGPR